MTRVWLRLHTPVWRVRESSNTVQHVSDRIYVRILEVEEKKQIKIQMLKSQPKCVCVFISIHVFSTITTSHPSHLEL